MPEYVVTWAMPIDAETPVDAARQALAIVRDPDSIATVFSVDDGRMVYVIDVEDPDEPITLGADFSEGR